MAGIDDIRKKRSILKSNWDLLDTVTSDQAAGRPVPEMQKPIPEGAKLFDLVAVEEIPEYAVTAQQAISRRQSHRKYLDETISLQEFSFLLWATQGVSRVTPTYSRRTAPSAGARHSVETYIYADKIEGISRGLYRYLALQHKLCLISDSSDMGDKINTGLHGQRWNSGAVFVWTSIPYRMEWRYSVASHKLIALDVGHICQNLYIACECINCGTCAIGAYDQKLLDSCLGVDGTDEFAIYAAPVGKIGSS